MNVIFHDLIGPTMSEYLYVLETMIEVSSILTNASCDYILCSNNVFTLDLD